MALSLKDDRIFVMKRPAAEKALSDSIDVGGMVISALNKLSKLLVRFPVASKILISFDILLTSYDISSGILALVIFEMAEEILRIPETIGPRIENTDNTER